MTGWGTGSRPGRRSTSLGARRSSATAVMTRARPAVALRRARRGSSPHAWPAAVATLRGATPPCARAHLNFTVADPVDPSNPNDVEAARRIDGQMNRIFLDPIFRGEYPPTSSRTSAVPGLERRIRDGDLATIAAIDVLGVNYYNGGAFSHLPPKSALNAVPATSRPTRSPFPAADGARAPARLPITSMDWEVQPEDPDPPTRPTARGVRGAREHHPARHRERRGVRRRGGRGRVCGRRGPGRLRAVASRVGARRARRRGAACRATSTGPSWTTSSGREAAWRFGIVRVDYETQVRTPKASALDLARIISTRELPSGGNDV